MNIPLFAIQLTPKLALVAIVAGWAMMITSWIITGIIFRVFMSVLKGISGSSLSMQQGMRWMDYIESWAMQISSLIGVFIVLLFSWWIVNALM